MATKEEMVLLVKAVQNNFIGPQVAQQVLDIQKAYADQKKTISLVTILTKKQLLTPFQLRFITTGEGVSIDLANSAECSQIPGYEIFDKCGQGGMATVFTAYSDALKGDVVALKILFPHHYHNQRFVEGFLNEARLLSELDHPNLVRGYDYGKGGDLYYMALEFVDGQSVQDLLEQHGRLEEDLALHIILQVARALDYLGQIGITHRDIKPDNMLMNARGDLKLIDLGFAKDASTADEAGVTCGTVQYISPEQARGRSDVDIRSDIYSLGATLYHLVIGEVPFSGADNMEVMAQQVLAELSSEKTKGGVISHHMHYFIEKMMAKERDIRYQSPREIIDDIESVVSGNRELSFKPDQDPSSGSSFDILGDLGSNGRKRGGSSARNTESSRRRAIGSARREDPNRRSSLRRRESSTDRGAGPKSIERKSLDSGKQRSDNTTPADQQPRRSRFDRLRRRRD